MFFVLIFLFLFSFRSSTAAKGISPISKIRWGEKNGFASVRLLANPVVISEPMHLNARHVSRVTMMSEL